MIWYLAGIYMVTVSFLQGMQIKLNFLLHGKRIILQQIDKRSINISRFTHCVIQFKRFRVDLVANEDVVEIRIQMTVVSNVFVIFFNNRFFSSYFLFRLHWCNFYLCFWLNGFSFNFTRFSFRVSFLFLILFSRWFFESWRWSGSRWNTLGFRRSLVLFLFIL